MITSDNITQNHVMTYPIAGSAIQLRPWAIYVNVEISVILKLQVPKKAWQDTMPRQRGAMEEDTKDALNLYTIRLRQVVYVFRTQFALGPLKPRYSYNYRLASSYISISFVVFLFDVFRNHLALDIANQLATCTKTCWDCFALAWIGTQAFTSQASVPAQCFLWNIDRHFDLPKANSGASFEADLAESGHLTKGYERRE